MRLHHKSSKRIFARLARFFVVLLAVIALSPPPCQAWEWEDFLGSSDDIAALQTQTLTMDDIREMRVRDIKRRLARTHGYSADELGRMLDKKELIEALSFEEHKDREKELEKVKRYVIVRGIIMALVAVVVVLGWPLWVQIYEVASVNLVVYLDKKRYEASRCMELGSIKGMIGVILMGIVDTLQIWLSLSVLLSWFMSSKFFFPTPNLSVRPAEFMGDKVAKGPLAKYGLNVGPMALTWGFRFIQGQLNAFTGRALSQAYQQQKQAAREWETPEDKAARKAARKAAKKAAREEAEMKKREDQMAEAQRRKEVAVKATAALFPPNMRNEPADNHGDDAESDRPDQSDQEFQQEMDNVDMDDLD